MDLMSDRKYSSIFEYIRGILKNIKIICLVCLACKGRNRHVRPSPRSVRDIRLPLDA
jgi:hypothetical protein